MDKPTFEEVFPEIERLIQTHKWRQQLRGMELEDLEQEMRRLAYKAWLNWDPTRGPLKVLWWRCVVNFRMTYYSWLDNPKRNGPPEESFDVVRLEDGDADSTFYNLIVPPEEDDHPYEGIDDPLLKKLCFLYEYGYPEREIRALLKLSTYHYYVAKENLYLLLTPRDPVYDICLFCGTKYFKRAGRGRPQVYCSLACGITGTKQRQRSSATVV